MRKLLYVPIIHSQSDMGSLGSAMDQASASMIGENRWVRHKNTVSRFWSAIGDYLASVDATNLKIYQDGLAADGEWGRRVVEEASKRGSKNHQIVLSLMNRGAEVRCTEDLSLLLEEGTRLLQATQGGLGGQNAQDYRAYRQQNEALTERRDRVVADTIDKTLKDEETGLLFMGAYHNVLPLLAKDILVEAVKDQDKVKSYFDELLTGSDEGRLEQLADYLTSPI